MKEFLKNIEKKRKDFLDNFNYDNIIEFKKDFTSTEIAFVDSGFQEIGNNLFFIKIYSSIWRNNKKIKIFHTELLFNENNKDHYFIKNNLDTDIKIEAVNAEEIENEFLKILQKKLEPGTIIIRDGSLDNNIFKETIKEANKNNILFLGLSKNTELYKEYKILINIINKNLFYFNINTNLNKNLHFNSYLIKLNEESKHLFRIDIPDNIPIDINKIFGIISLNCIDPVFPGYPYGLIDVDEFARVSNEEINFLKIKLKFEHNLDLEIFDNVHKILDNLKY